MVKNNSLEEIINQYPEKYQKINQDFKKTAKGLYNLLKDESKIVQISHKADADGLGSLILSLGLRKISDFLGVNPEINTQRIMSFSSNPEDENSIESIVQKYGQANYIITDIGNLNFEQAKKVIKNQILIIDHHIPKTWDIPKGVRVVNPCLYDINGGEELSASIISTILLQYMFGIVKKKFGNIKDKKLQENLRTLERYINYSGLFGIAGSKADMQNYYGLNKAVYDYYIEIRMLEQIKNPFYGDSNKSAERVISQTTPIFNLKYQIPSLNDINKFLGNHLKSKFKLNETNYDKYKYIFVKAPDNGIEINMHYVKNNLRTTQILSLNNLMPIILGEDIFKITENDITLNPKFKESEFITYKDNIFENQLRIERGNFILSDNGINPKLALRTQQNKIEDLISLYEDNIIAFGDPEEIEYNLLKLRTKQYRVKYDETFTNEISIAELANFMTSSSKMGYGELMIETILAQLDNQHKIIKTNTEKLREIHKEYKLSLYNGMRKIEGFVFRSEDETFKKIFNKQLNRHIYIMNMDFLKETVSKELNLETIVGVFGGMMSNTGYLEGDKGIIFTYCTANKEISEYKISVRATDSQTLQKLKLNEFMENFGGGGHNLAAACRIGQTQITEFITAIENYKFM